MLLIILSFVSLLICAEGRSVDVSFVKREGKVEAQIASTLNRDHIFEERDEEENTDKREETEYVLEEEQEKTEKREQVYMETRCQDSSPVCLGAAKYDRCEFGPIGRNCPCACGGSSSGGSSNGGGGSNNGGGGSSYNGGSNNRDQNSGSGTRIDRNDVETPGLSADENTMFNEQNKRREHHSVPLLTWDTQLASSAKRWCNELARTDSFKHSMWKDTNGNNMGENLYYSGGYSGVPARAIKAWYDEIEYYDYSNPQFSGATGHFTAMIWRSTDKVGCGMSRSNSNKDYVCCHYTPMGNMRGDFADNVTRPRGGRPYSD